jgi:hypothetical protein
MMTKLCVSGGGSLHDSGGELSSPSQVNFSGMRSPDPKAVLVKRIVATRFTVGAAVGAGVAVGFTVGVTVGAGVIVGSIGVTLGGAGVVSDCCPPQLESRMRTISAIRKRACMAFLSFV